MSQAKLFDLLDFRAVRKEDINFIFSSWLDGLWYGNEWYKEIPRKVFLDNYFQVLQAIIYGPDTLIDIACLKDDPDVIIGYSVATKENLHWVFVRPDWRKIGLANKLTPRNIKTVTHITLPGRSIKRRKKWVFNPFMI